MWVLLPLETTAVVVTVIAVVGFMLLRMAPVFRFYVMVPEGCHMVIRGRKNARKYGPGRYMKYTADMACVVRWTSPYVKEPLVQGTMIPDRISITTEDSQIFSSEGVRCTVRTLMCLTVADPVVAVRGGDVTHTVCMSMIHALRKKISCMSVVDFRKPFDELLQTYMMERAKSVDCYGVTVASFAVLDVAVPKEVTAKLDMLALFRALELPKAELHELQSKTLKKSRALQLEEREHQVQLKSIDARVEQQKLLFVSQLYHARLQLQNELRIIDDIAKTVNTGLKLEALTAYANAVRESRAELSQTMTDAGATQSSISTVLGTAGSDTLGDAVVKLCE